MTTKTKNQTNAPVNKPASTGSSDLNFRRMNSTELFEGDKELRIQHEDREYRLRITRLNKLILTV